MGRKGLLLAVSFWLFMASMAVAAVWLVEPARAESPAATGHERATLVIHVQNVSQRGGILRLGLYDAAHYPADTSPLAAADVKAEAGETVITLKDLAPGRYAIESFQDVNGDGKMNLSWLGLPLEPYGFSRDARPFLSKPGFNGVAFTLAPGENHQTLHLRNSDAVADAGF